MALEFLFSDFIEGGREIAVHPEATHLRCNKGYIKQYNCNPLPLDSMRKIPKGTNIIKFEKYFVSGYYIDYGNLFYISHNGNILKEGRY